MSENGRAVNQMIRRPADGRDGSMGRMEYPIHYDESVNYWWITDVQKEIFNSPCETFEAEVNLGEAYVQIVYPIRKEFLRQNLIAGAEYYEGTYDRVYFPFENNRVDFTTFEHRPHHMWVYGKTELLVDEEGDYPFEIYTCGGMKTWLNGTEVLCFTPYTRNIPGKEFVNLHLNAGLNELVIYADELAERDVFFYYEFRYKGEKPLKGAIELGEYVEEVLDTELFLKSCYLPRDLVKSGNVVVHYDSTLLKEDKKINVSFGRANGDDATVTARKAENELVIGAASDFRVGAFALYLSCRAGEFFISRKLVEGVSCEEASRVSPADTESLRKQQALQFLCEQGGGMITATLAVLEVEGKWNEKAIKGLDESLEMIENWEDCADFCLSPLFLLMTKYQRYLSKEQYDRIRSAVLNFRYWIDEPGNDVMWYFSENHAMLFHVGQYLAGYLFPEEEFTVSGRLGREQYEIGKKRVEGWFSHFEKYGFAEWNSGTYIPVDLIGFFTLYMAAPDQQIRDKAKRAIDFTFRLMCCNTYHGVLCSSFGRCYEDTLKIRTLMEPNFLTWTAYGVGRMTAGARSVTLYAISDYEAPKEFGENQPGKGQWLSVELDQGINGVKTYGYKTSDYFLACVRRFKPFVHGHQQHLMNLAIGAQGAQFFINHPGERTFSGENRPSYWAGNGTMPYIEQYRNVMMMVFHTDPEELVHHIHAYFPVYDYDEYEIDGNWVYIKSGNGYAGCWFSNGVSMTKYGANTGKELISQGLDHAVVVKAGSESEHGSFERFKEGLKAAEVKWDGKNGVIFREPEGISMEITDVGRVMVNGKILPFEPCMEMKIEKGNF